MLFNRMIVMNVEKEHSDEAERFVYKLTDSNGDEMGFNHFGVAGIRLLDNGWVEVTRHDTGIECFPPSRVVTLERDPVIYAVSDRPSHG